MQQNHDRAVRMPLGKRRSNAPLATIDSLEPRQLLSVSTATLAGPTLTKGASFDVDIAIGDTFVAGSSVVVGPTTFDGKTSVETDASTPFGDNEVYEALTSNGLVSYGGLLGPLQNHQTLSPYQVILPPSLTAGKVVTDSWKETDAFDDSTLSASETFDLVSETPEPVTVAAGTFSSYEIYTALTTNNSGTVSTQYQIQFWSPTVGQIAIEGAASNNFVSVGVSSELVSYSIPSSGPVAAKLVFSQQPTKVAAGAVITPAVKVDVESSASQIVTTDTSKVTLAIASGPAGGKLGGTLSENAVAGVATFSNLTLSVPGTYTLIATDGTLTSVKSSSFTVTAAQTAPVVTVKPVSQTVAAGTTVKFTAAATGNPTPTVQWQLSTNAGKTFTNISKATATTYSFTAAASLTGDQYRAVFTNAKGSATTTAAVLTVGTAPKITAEPKSVTVKTGSVATFTITTTASPAPTVQWQVSTNAGKTFTNISKAIATSYTVTATASETGYQYRAVVTNVLGTATSTAAVLTVTVPPVVTVQPMSKSVAAGKSVSFIAAATGSPTPTVQWQFSTNGTVWTNISGATATTYTFTALAADNNRKYRAVFTNTAGTATSNAATLVV